MSPPLETSNARKEILEYWPEISNPHVRRILAKVEILQDILRKNTKGGATRSDWFKAARILLSLNRRELIYLLLSLGQRESPSIFPYALKFIKRKTTEFDKERNDRLKVAEKKDKRIRDEDAVVELVTKLRMETDESIENILIDISLPDRSRELLALDGAKTPSLSTIRILYNSGIKRARTQGYVEAITSCVVMPSDDPVRPTKPLTAPQQQGVDAYLRAANQHGIWQGDQFNGITTEKWRDEFYQKSTSDTADGKRKAFKRLRDALTKLGLLAVDGEINLLTTPSTRSLTPPFGGIGDAFAGILMRDSGTLPGQSRDRSPDS